jgi:hypothetical protein
VSTGVVVNCVIVVGVTVAVVGVSVAGLSNAFQL